jgi:hypothetical protein
MMGEYYLEVNNNTVFSLARLKGKKELLVFFHGIGDSHLNFEYFFMSRAFIIMIYLSPIFWVTDIKGWLS